jgi:hypothetical protein
MSGGGIHYRQPDGSASAATAPTKGSAKILFAGDTNGNLAGLMKAVEKANSKAGPFDAVLCVGSFFGDGSAGPFMPQLIPYLCGKATVPVPTFFICGAEPEGEMPVGLPDAGCEICPNLTYLGRRGFRNVVPNLTVGFLSGIHDPTTYGHRREAAAGELEYDRSYRVEDIGAQSTHASPPGCPATASARAHTPSLTHHLAGESVIP